MAKRDPFDDDDETIGPKIERTDSGDDKTDQVSTEPDPNDEETEQAGESEEQKQARKQARKERGELRKAADAERQRAADLERQLNDERAARIATEATARQIAEYQRWQQAQPQVDPWQQAIDNEVTSRRAALRAEHAELNQSGKYDAEAQKRLMAEWQKTETRLQEIVTHKQLYQFQQSQPRPNPQQAAQDAEAAAFNARIRTEFPEIVANEKHVRHMVNNYFALLEEGKPNTWETAQLAASKTRLAFKLGTRPAPDAATKARYSGVGGGANGHASGDGSIEMTPKFKRMAEARFPDDKPGVAWKKWAQGPGKKMLADES